MAYAQYSYYIDTFKGTPIPEATFNRLAEIASDVIDGIVHTPVESLDTASTAYGKVQRACCYIIESLNANGGVDSIMGFSESAKNSESLGDYSYSGGNASMQSQGSAVWYGDIRIPAIIPELLRAAGLTCRWAYAGTVIDDGH